MKTKILLFLMKNKGNLSLFLITFIATLLCGLLFGSMAGGCLGILSLIGIDAVAESVHMRLGDTARPGILGITLGVLILIL